MKKLLIISPNGFLPQYDLFTDYVIGKKISDEKKYKVIFATSFTKNTKMISKYNDILTYRLPFLFFSSRFVSLPLSILMSLFLLITIRPDALFVHHFRSNSHFLIVFAKLFGIKTILGEWGILHDEYLTDDRDNPLRQKLKVDNIIYNKKTFNKSKNKLKDKIYNYLRHWKWYNVDKIIFYSKHNFEYIDRLNIVKPNIQYLPCYLNLQSVKIEDSFVDIDGKYDFIRNKKLVFLIGQLKKRKGYDIFLEVAKCISKERDDVVFVLASGTNNKIEIKKINDEIKKFNLNDKIKFLFKISNEERNFLYKHTHTYLMPSRYEGFGLPAIEAGYNGALVVASNVPALNEFLVDGQNSLLFENENIEEAIAKIRIGLNLSEENKESLIHNMYETCEAFDIKNIQFEELI